MTTTDPALRPPSLDDYVGQPAMKARLRVHMQAALAGKRALPHVLFTGPPGVGKTTLAHLIAKFMGDELVEISKPPTPAVFGQMLYDLGAGIMFVDEIHRLGKSLQEDLLTLLQDGVYDTGRYRYECPNITVIGATTEPEKVIPPLRDRFQIAPQFEPYSDEDLGAVVQGMAARAGSSIYADPELCAALGRAAAGIPRRAMRLVVAARDIEEAEGLAPTAEAILAFTQVDPDGLDAQHRRYLAELAHLGGRAGRELLGSRLGLHPSSVTEVERLLLDRRLVILEPTGRVLTPEGRARAGGGGRRRSRLDRLSA